MPAQRHTRDSIIKTLQNVAAQLNQSCLSERDVQPHIPRSSVNYHFGNVGNALKAAGLEMRGQDIAAHIARFRFTDDKIFGSLLDIEQRIGREPTQSEYRVNGGKCSGKPFRTRFGKWDVAMQHYRKWKSENGTTLETPVVQEQPVADSDNANESITADSVANPVSDQNIAISARPRKAPQLFGEPIDFRGLRHAPINEQGVVYLFGMVSRELGFSVEALQQGFPDCEGKYLHDKKRKLWAKARIEFEFRALNFRLHGHDENECDVIVCWENDWPDCPLRVVELKSEIMRLPSR